MSDYTTQLRWPVERRQYETKSSPDDYSKCYAMLGLDKYPIFDESYRSFLNDKIIRHFYFREIGFETLAQFRWYVRTTMDENMPYFNQLYDSLNLIKDPITNQSYTWGEVYTMAQDEGTKTDKTENDVFEEDVTKNTEDVTRFGKTVSQTGTHENDTNEVDEYGKTDTRVTSYGKTDQTDTTYGKTDTTSGSDTKTTTYGKTEDTTSTVTYGKQQDTRNGGSDSVIEGATHERVIHSDTPMNQISNSGVENLNYASDVTYTDRNGTGAGTTTYGGTTHIQDGGSDTTETEFQAGGQDVVTSNSSGSSRLGGTDTTKGKLGGSDTTTDTQGGADEKTIHDEGTQTTNSQEGGTQSQTVESDEKTISTSQKKGNVESDRNLDEHGNREHNRKGYDGTSPSKLLTEYRETFLNVDLQVIHSLDVLFFGMWN